MINKVSFCILSNELSPNNSLNLLIQSIISQDIPNYEIIIAYSDGNINKVTNNKIHYFSVQKLSSKVNLNKKLEQHKKRQIMTSHAKYENIIFLKDYHVLDENWYTNIKMHNTDFNVIVGKVLFQNNKRYLDRCIGEYTHQQYDYRNGILIPYEINKCGILKKLDMYVSGATFLVKKSLINKLFKKFQKHEFIKDYDICKFIFTRINYEITLSNSIIISRKQNLTPKYINRNRLVQNIEEIIEL